jgi:hypothetical protein
LEILKADGLEVAGTINTLFNILLRGSSNIVINAFILSAMAEDVGSEALQVSVVYICC